MQITVNNDFSNGPRPFTQQEIDSFLQDEQTAVNILNSTFTNNISLTFNVGFGSFKGKPMAPTDGGFGDVNIQTAVGLPYSQLRANLLTFGQPGFFNAANLPAGDSINGISDFWVSSSVAAAFGLAAPNRPPDAPDGFIGINNIAFAPGAQRIVAFLHEFGHAMGRVPNNFDADPEGVISSELDLVRFVSPGNRLFDGDPPVQAAYFSLDGGAKKVADWDTISPSDFLSPLSSNLTPNDPFNNRGFGGDLAKLTTADLQLMEALGFRVGPTAVMVLQRSDGFFQSYVIGSNAISANSQLGPVGPDWQFVTLGGFKGSSTTSDMLLRNSTSGAFQVYNINNNQITDSAPMGQVGLNWQFFGVGNFSGIPGRDFADTPGNTDMMLRDSNTGRFEVYNISNNQITGPFFIGDVGLNWQFSGIGNFSGIPGASDMILRNTDTGELLDYNMSNNRITGDFSIGTVGLEWQFSGVGNFSSNPGESDMILRNTDTGELLVYNISNNRITGDFSIGTVGLEWQFAGVAPIRVPGAADLLLRNVNSGEFWVYNIANNQLTGDRSLAAVGPDWQLGGFAPTAANGFIRNSGGPLASQPAAGSASQLVQAMAGFTGSSGAGESLNTAPLSADMSQQPLLTTPQHA
jgi:hypothetical protein